MEGWVHSYRLKTVLCQRPSKKGQCSCCTLTSQMIAHHDELSLLDKAGSQVDKGRAWRYELQLALSAPIASCRMNKLTSCHNISKWISGDLDSKCISPRPALCWKQRLLYIKLHHPVCQSLFHKNFHSYTHLGYFTHMKTNVQFLQSNKPRYGTRNEVRLHCAFIQQGILPVFNVIGIQREGLNG